jgi:hypothetical protein
MLNEANAWREEEREQSRKVKKSAAAYAYLRSEPSFRKLTGERMLTEAAAWRKIARKIVTGKWAKEGLCCEVAVLRFNRQISDTMEGRMYDRIDSYIRGSGYWKFPYAYPKGEEPEGRALAALWMVLEAEEDAREQSRKVKK